MEAEVRTETYGAAVVDSVADGVNHKCLDLAEVLAVSADSQEWVAADMAVASEVDTECLRCLDLVEALVVVLAVGCLDSAEDLEVGCGNLKTDGMLNLHMAVVTGAGSVECRIMECRNCTEEDGNDNALESST